jgi:hypothetical protein
MYTRSGQEETDRHNSGLNLALEDPGKANTAPEGRGTTGKMVLSLMKERLNAHGVGLMAGQIWARRIEPGAKRPS